jgi:hypothetical protein
MRPGRVIARVVAAAGLVVALDVPRSDASEAYVYTHNGSSVLMGIAADHVSIQYSRPRPGIAGAGIAPGTTLFEGRLHGETIEGTAYTFRRGCPPAPYGVRGRMAGGTRLILSGAAPIWGQGCEVVGYTARSPHARLIFDFVSAQEGE